MGAVPRTKNCEKYNVPGFGSRLWAGEYRKAADDLINNYKLAAIGNAGEIASLVACGI